MQPALAAQEYSKKLQLFFNGEIPAFDLILLGLGDNSHTASLFPNTPVLKDELPGVKEVWLADKQVYRITLNAPLINLAKNIAFLVYGEDKAEAVQHVLEGEKNINEYPAQLIRTDDTVEWFLDEAAAAKVIAI